MLWSVFVCLYDVLSGTTFVMKFVCVYDVLSRTTFAMEFVCLYDVLGMFDVGAADCARAVYALNCGVQYTVCDTPTSFCAVVILF